MQGIATLELGILGDEHGDHRLGGGVLLPIEEVLLGDAEEVAQHGLRLGEALGVGVHELVVDGEIAGHGLVVGEHGLLVVGVQDDLAAEARVAALHALRGLIDEQHLRAGVGGVAGGHGTGTAEADDDDVVLAVPSDGVGEGGSPVARVGHGLIGRGLRRAAGKAEAGDGGHADTSAGDELSAGVFSTPLWSVSSRRVDVWRRRRVTHSLRRSGDRGVPDHTGHFSVGAEVSVRDNL